MNPITGAFLLGALAGALLVGLIALFWNQRAKIKAFEAKETAAAKAEASKFEIGAKKDVVEIKAAGEIVGDRLQTDFFGLYGKATAEVRNLATELAQVRTELDAAIAARVASDAAAAAAKAALATQASQPIAANLQSPAASSPACVTTT